MSNTIKKNKPDVVEDWGLEDSGVELLEDGTELDPSKIIEKIYICIYKLWKKQSNYFPDKKYLKEFKCPFELVVSPRRYMSVSSI